MSQRVLKAHDPHDVGTRIVFNYDDLQKRCVEELTNARQQAAELLEQVKEEAVQLRAKAREEGFGKGREEGLLEAQRLIREQAEQQARLMVGERLRTALPALEQAVYALEIERDRWLRWWETAAIQLSATFAEKIIRDELRHRPELAVGMIRELLQLASGQPHLRVRMHPLDLQLLEDVGTEILDRLSRAGESTLLADDAVTRGGCIIETQHGRIDGQVRTQLDRMIQELLDDTQAIDAPTSKPSTN